MTTERRLKKVINWLIYREVAENERAVADLLGYTKSSFSQIMNGRVPLSEKFVSKLCQLDQNINEVWILTGEGDMFLSDNLNSEETQSVVIRADAWEVIKKQADSLTARDRQVDALITMLQEELAERKKATVRQDAPATSAAVG
ncbi:XRE family transcriptional regulator [Muribaculum intestinale]|jgi:hypothetical protein|uniref:XRE family transcriptional regulator n=1 Tax=Muribaculum intestinale TaxID=1796646 RepID=UPI0025B64A45|nr:XRE family transcriptional regulator [Muribaculum intestinale]